MYNTNSSHILAHTAVSGAEARAEELDMVLPGWDVDELTGEEGGRYVREGDFPLDEQDEGFVSEADWAAFLEMTYTDRMEWEDR